MPTSVSVDVRYRVDEETGRADVFVLVPALAIDTSAETEEGVPDAARRAVEAVSALWRESERDLLSEGELRACTVEVKV